MKNPSFIAAAAAFAVIVEREYLAALAVHEDNPRLYNLGTLGNILAVCLAEVSAASLQDMAAKAGVLKLRIVPSLQGDFPHECCCEQERLAWSMAEDATRLAAQQFKPDPALGATEAYQAARAAYNACDGADNSPENAALWKALEDATADAYRTGPTTADGVRALVEVLISNEAGCAPDLETHVAMETLLKSLGGLSG